MKDIIDKYLMVEAKTLSRGELQRRIKALEKMPGGTDEKDDATVDVMDAMDDIRREFVQMINKMGGFSSQDMRAFDNAYEHSVNSVGAMADKDTRVTAKNALQLYQKWINVTTGIVNVRQKINKRALKK